MEDRVECLLEVHKAHIQWLLVLACLAHQYFEIRDLVFCPPSLSESRLFICNFCFGLHLDSFQYDVKKDLACMRDKSSCSVICTLFKITILGKWNKRGERPLSGHSTVSQITTRILCILSSTVSPPGLNISAGTSSGPVFTIPFQPVCNLCSFSQIFISRWLDTLQTWLELSSRWLDYLEKLPGISFWLRCFQFHTHAFRASSFLQSFELLVGWRKKYIRPIKILCHLSQKLFLVQLEEKNKRKLINPVSHKKCC